jgi:uncharacterized membrane protein YfcA
MSTSIANSAAQEGSIITSCLSFVAYTRHRKRLVSLGGVVGSTALLMSPAGAITGQSLRVDGGAGINTVALPLDQHC